MRLIAIVAGAHCDFAVMAHGEDFLGDLQVLFLDAFRFLFANDYIVLFDLRAGPVGAAVTYLRERTFALVGGNA